MDLSMSVAKTSMDMAQNQVMQEASVIMLKKSMEMMTLSATQLLQTMGIGQNLDISA
jgi:hypothetical protein